MKTSFAHRTRELPDQAANSPTTMAHLRAHAPRRLECARGSLPAEALRHLAADDFVQEVLSEAYAGALTCERGLHPKWTNLANPPAFIHFLRSTLNQQLS